ncbi:hypothetical protein ES708_14683 [subsurface metagenome]
MVKIINIFGDQYSGQAGKAGVFAKWKGRQYRRAYVIPANPNTIMQQAIRGYFRNAITAWHTYHSIQRLVFSYLATGLVMSGMNLLVRRWQLAATKALTLPIPPNEGIKQIASAESVNTDEATGGTANPHSLTKKPVSIGTCVFTSATVTEDQAAQVDIEMGDVRIPITIIGTLGETATPGVVLATGDKLLISYTSGGRTITDEELAEATEMVGDTDFEFKAQTIRTQFYPIDFKSVVLKILDDSESTKPQIESEEVDNILGKTYLDNAAAYAADDTHTYTSFTPLENSKLEVTKVDTSFITWRRYSDENGHVPVAQTIEDETYDWKLTAGGYVGVTRAAQSSILATKHELVVLEAIS